MAEPGADFGGVKRLANDERIVFWRVLLLNPYVEPHRRLSNSRKFNVSF